MNKAGLTFSLSMLVVFNSWGQTKISLNKLIDHTMHFYETKKDSIKINAEQIRKEALRLNLKQEGLYYHRFMGFYYEYDNQPDKALASYHTLLNKAEEGNFTPEKYQALGDMVSVYFNQNQQSKAKEVILKALKDAPQDKPKEMVLSTFYNNLGMIYAKETKLDSALLMYNKSLIIKNKIGDLIPIADLKTNMAALYLRKGDFLMAEKLTNECYKIHKEQKMTEDLWFDLMSFANIYNSTKRMDKALQNAREAERIAIQVNSKPKQMDTYEVLSDIFSRMGDFKQALDYQRKYVRIKDEVINSESAEKVAELQEKYESEKKQRINVELTHSLTRETEKQKLYLLALILSLLVIGVLVFAFVKNKQKNKIIESKNRQLSRLNSQKNNLISMVSHDLKTPFLSIRALSHALKLSKEDSQSEYINDIVISSERGLEMIAKILENEKFGGNTLDLTEVSVFEILNEVLLELQPLAKQKSINIVNPNSANYKVMTDRLLLKSALQNVISNAINYSPKGTNVYSSIKLLQDSLTIQIADEGPGINHTHEKNEYSTGMGLGIVKRIMQELGGQVQIDSDKGTVVNLIIPIVEK